MSNLGCICAIIIAISIIQSAAKEDEPYLVITTVHNHKPVYTIEVGLGQNISLECTVTPSYYSILWHSKRKQMKLSMTFAILNISNIDIYDLGIYTCESPSIKLKRNVTLTLKKRFKRDYDPFEYPGKEMSFEDALRLSKKLADEALAESRQKSINEYINSMSINHESLDHNHQRKKNMGFNIGIAAVALAVVSGVIIVVYKICKYYSNENIETTSNSFPQRTNGNVELQLLNTRPNEPSSFRPIQTCISPYPPERNTSLPSAPSAEPDTPPPPSYNEAMSNVMPQCSDAGRKLYTK